MQNPAAWMAVVVGGLCLFASTADARDVTVETQDGSTYEGRLISEQGDAIILEIKRGSIVGRVTIPRREIARRSDEALAPAPWRADAQRARGIEDPEERARQLVEVARGVALSADPAEAAELYREAGRVDPALRDQTDVAAAQALIAVGREAEAEAVLREALERNPKNAAARAAVRSLAEAFAKLARERIEPGVRLFMDQQHRRALRSLVLAVEELPRHVVDAASEKVKERTGLTLAQIMVDCRLRARCTTCEGAGVRECPAASSNASTRCRFGRTVHHLRPERIGPMDFARYKECRRCQGKGHLTCKACLGLGMHLTRPTAYERDQLVETLQGELTGLSQRAEKLTQTVEKDQREASVRTVAATELIDLLHEMRAYAKSLSQLDARAGAIGGGDLRRKERRTSKRMAAIMTALANGLYIAGEQRYESAVSHDGPLNENGQIVPLAVRAVRARQAWEVVNQARVYTLEALELDPSTAGAARGDMKRRLALMDRFLSRTWKTYMLLRAVEEGEAQAKEVFAAVFGAGASGGLDPEGMAEAMSGAQGKGSVEGSGGGTGRGKKQ